MSLAFSPTFPTRVERVSTIPVQAPLHSARFTIPRFTILEIGATRSRVRNTGILESTEPPPLRDAWIYSHTLPVFTTTRTTRLELVVRAVASLLMQLSD